MKSRKALPLDQLAQIDRDRMIVYEALKSWWGWKGTNHIDVRSGPDHIHEPEVQAAIDSSRSQRRDQYMELVQVINSFQSQLCGLLNISHMDADLYASALLLGSIDTWEVILDGDEGVRTYIDYGRATQGKWEHGDNPPYKLRMMSKEMTIETYATNTQDLLTKISRGYTCLRILDRGTRYYHNKE